VLQLESYSGSTPVPGSPPHVEGVVQVRGRVLPVVSLRSLFGHTAEPPSFDTRIVVVRLGTRVVALLVDSSRHVLAIDATKIQAAPAVLSEQSNGFIAAVAQLDQRLILLLDIPKILGQERTHDESLALNGDDASRIRALPG
jgi:purine-binding chemotaxis protein CheW